MTPKSLEFDVLKAADEAISRRMEALQDDYEDKGLSETEIREMLAADKWKIQKEVLDELYPGQDISPNVFNGFSPNGAKDRLDNIEQSDPLREMLSDDADGDVPATPVEDEESHEYLDVVPDEFRLLSEYAKQNDPDLPSVDIMPPEQLSDGDVPTPSVEDEDSHEYLDVVPDEFRLLSEYAKQNDPELPSVDVMPPDDEEKITADSAEKTEADDTSDEEN